MDAGKEPFGHQGTIQMTTRFYLTDKSDGVVSWFAWGHPDSRVEYSFQSVALRTSVNIWHKVYVEFAPDCNDTIQVVKSRLRGSSFPSHRLWENGVLTTQKSQGLFSSLWRSDVKLGASFVTEDGTGPFATQWPLH